MGVILRELEDREICGEDPETYRECEIQTETEL